MKSSFIYAAVLLLAPTLALTAAPDIKISREQEEFFETKIRPLLVASARAGVQLVGVGVVLLVLFQHAGLWSALGWVVVMVAVGGQVAGRHGQGVALARVAATVGIAPARA